MSANVSLAGFPPVFRMRFFQGSTVKPGKLIVDTMVVGPDNLQRLPRLTSLTLNARNFTGNWTNLRVVKTRVRFGRTRVVLKDSRWLLDAVTMGNNYNLRDSEGNLMSDSEKDITQLLNEIGVATGLTFTAGDLPPYKPRARWAGKTAAEALGQLLRDTGCRLVYNPQTGHYNVSLAGTGSYPDVSKRALRPGPPPNIQKVIVRSAPVLYEDELDATAKQINPSTGETEALVASNLATTPTSDHAHTRFRLWEPDAVTHPEATPLSRVLFNDHRAKSHVPDPEQPVHERARIIPDEWDMYPHHQPLYTPDESLANQVKLTGGGKVFITEQPVLMRTGNSLSKMAKLLTSYYIIDDDGKLKREEKEKEIDADAADTLEIDIDWIKTIDSTQADVGPALEWDTLHQQVLDAIASKYDPQSGEGPQKLSLALPVGLSGSGQVGAVEYYFSTLQHRAKMEFKVALNFVPGSQGNLS